MKTGIIVKSVCKRVTIAALVTFFLVACSGSGDETPAADDKPKAQGTGVIPKHQIDTLNRAKAVDDKVLAADEERRKQLEAMQ